MLASADSTALRLAASWLLLLTARRATSVAVRPLPRIMFSSLACSSCVTLPTGASGPAAPGAAAGGASVGLAGAAAGAGAGAAAGVCAKPVPAQTTNASTLRATRALLVMDDVP